MSDTYQYAKSLEKQSMKIETPFESKNWQFVGDINNGVYAPNNCLVNFDLSSIYSNSETMINMSEAFVAIPTVMCSSYVSNNTLGTQVVAANIFTTTNPSWQTAVMKGYHNLVHQCDMIFQGKSADTLTPFINAKIQWNLLSSMSQDDLNNLGPSLGLSNLRTNPKSMRYNGSSQANYQTVGTGVAGNFPTVSSANSNAATPFNGYIPCGNGMTNNVAYIPTSGAMNDGDQGGAASQNYNTYNESLERIAARLPDLSVGAFATGTPVNQMYGSSSTTNIMNQQQINNEFRPFFNAVQTGTGVTFVFYDIAIVRLKDISDLWAKLPLSRRLDARLSFYLNTGGTGVMIGGHGEMTFSQSAYTITNTCPYINTYIPVANIPASTTGLVTSVGICRPNTTSIFGLNFGTLGIQSHAMPSCRIYYPVYKFKPHDMLEYCKINRHKSLLYTRNFFYVFNGITSTGTFSQFITTGIRNIKGILILPLLSGSTNGAITSTLITGGIQNFSQYQSPFDTFPATTAPISLTNIVVSVGGQPVTSYPLNYTFENFLQQVNDANSINPGDYGLSCGLVDDYYWMNAYRAYYINLERGADSTKMDMQSINLSFINNSLQTIDCMVFVEYCQSAEIDIETSEFTLK